MESLTLRETSKVYQTDIAETVSCWFLEMTSIFWDECKHLKTHTHTHINASYSTHSGVAFGLLMMTHTYTHTANADRVFFWVDDVHISNIILSEYLLIFWIRTVEAWKLQGDSITNRLQRICRITRWALNDHHLWFWLFGLTWCRSLPSANSWKYPGAADDARMASHILWWQLPR